MQNKFEPWNDIRLKSSCIRPFMSEFDNSKWKLFFALDRVEELSAEISAYQQTQRAAICMAAGAIDYNLRYATKGNPQMDVRDSKQFNKDAESSCNIAKDYMKEELRDIISLCDRMKKAASGILESKYLEKTDYDSEIEAACDDVLEAIIGSKRNV